MLITVSPSETWSTAPVTDATRPSRCPASARELGRIVARRDRFDPAHLGVDADERRDLACVAAQNGDVDLVEDALCSLGAIGRRACSDRIEHDRDSALVRDARPRAASPRPSAARACRC